MQTSLSKITDYPAFLESHWQKHLEKKAETAPTFISTFAGTGGSSLGYSFAGFRELLAVEWDDHAAECFRQNFPGVELYHGDICQLSVEEILRRTGLQPGELSIFDGSPPCFVRGTNIITNLGVIPIELCTEDMLVLTHTGRFKKIIQTMSKQYKKEIFSIDFKYGRQSVNCTPEHPFWARKRSSVHKNRTIYKTYSEPQWIEAKDLKIGDVVCEPHILSGNKLEIPPVIKRQRINISGVSGKGSFEMRLINSECALDWTTRDFAWILGFYLAEGHTRGSNPTIENNKECRREVIFSIANDETDFIVNKISALGLHPQNRCHSQGSTRITVSNIDFWALCQVVGHGAANKFIPDAFHLMPLEWQEQFLDGYFVGDGCYLKNGKSHNLKRKATTVSIRIAQGISKMIASVFGVVAFIEKLYPAGSSTIQGRKVNVKETYSVGYQLPSSTRIRPGFVDNFGAWIPIKQIHIEETKELETVYNMEVEDDNSYTANGFAVHNCQGFSTSGKRDLNDNRNYLFLQYVRILRGLMPKAFVMENVSGMVKGKMKLIFAEILRELKACGYRVKAVLLNAKYFGVPQSRERMIFVGVREDLNLNPVHPRAKYQTVSLREATNGIETVGLPLAGRLAEIGKNARAGESFDETRMRMGQKGSNFSTQKAAWHKPVNTITKTMAPNYTGIVHPDHNNMLSIAALKRCGSFPDDFILTGTDIEQWARIGNSVPPLLMKAVAETIRENILR